MAVPDWLTRDFFQSCIQSLEKEPIRVTNFTTEPAIEPGNNYGSLLLRAKIDYIKAGLNSSISLIVKVPLTSLEDDFGSFYDKEITFYNKFVTETYKYDKHNIVPKHYLSSNARCIVLEDLSTCGFKMVDRHHLLDLEHCQQYIKAKAKLNALSIAVYRDGPELIDSMMGGSPKHNEAFQNLTKNIFNGSLKCMIAYLEDKPDYKEYVELFKECYENDTMWTMYKEEEESSKTLKSLIQVDPWCTNLMFKYNSLGTPICVKLLDFQNVAYLSPVRELVTFLTVSANMDVRRNHFNSLCNLFNDELNGNLALLKCPERLSLKQIKDEIVDLIPLIIFNICAVLPFSLVEGVVDISDYITGNILKEPVRESAIFKAYQGVHFDTIIPKVFTELAKEESFIAFKEKIKINKGNNTN